jgi:hypothetical protein
MKQEKIPIIKQTKSTYISYTFNLEMNLLVDWFSDYTKTMFLYSNFNKLVKPINKLNLDNIGCLSLWNILKNYSIKRKTIKKNKNNFEVGRIMKLLDINGIKIDKLNYYSIVHLYKNTTENKCTLIVRQNFKFDSSLNNEILENNRNYIIKINKYLNSLSSNFFIRESIMIMRPYTQIYKILMNLNVMNKKKFNIQSTILDDGIIIKKEKNENVTIKYNLIKLSNISTFIEIKQLIRKKDLNYDEQMKEILFNQLFLKKLREIMESFPLEEN